jgi:hypothetical protein
VSFTNEDEALLWIRRRQRLIHMGSGFHKSASSAFFLKEHPIL